MCKIRFIVETYSSEFDRNGNRKHFSVITSTMTGDYRTFRTDGQRNAINMLSKATGLGYENIHSVESDNIPIKAWKHASKHIARDEYKVTDDELKALEIPLWNRERT